MDILFLCLQRSQALCNLRFLYSIPFGRASSSEDIISPPESTGSEDKVALVHVAEDCFDTLPSLATARFNCRGCVLLQSQHWHSLGHFTLSAATFIHVRDSVARILMWGSSHCALSRTFSLVGCDKAGSKVSKVQGNILTRSEVLRSPQVFEGMQDESTYP